MLNKVSKCQILGRYGFWKTFIYFFVVKSIIYLYLYRMCHISFDTNYVTLVTMIVQS